MCPAFKAAPLLLLELRVVNESKQKLLEQLLENL